MERVASSGSVTGGVNDLFATYNWRWVNLMLFCFMSALQNFLVFGFAPISDSVVDYYQNSTEPNSDKIEIFHINLLNGVTLFTAIPLFIWGPRIISKYSLKASIYYLVTVDSIGAVLRYIFASPSYLNYWFIFLGQAIISLGQVVTWASTTKLSMVWFPEHERAGATSLSSMSNLLGIAISFSVSPLIVPQDRPDQVKELLMIHMITCLVMSFITIIFFKSAPPIAPSKASMLNLLEDTEETALLKQSIPLTHGGQFKILLKTKSFLVISAVFGMGFGYFNGLFTVLNQMMVPQGYTNSDVGLFGVLLIVCGILGAVLSGVIIGKTHRYRELIIVCVALATLCGLWFVFAVKPDNKAVICITLSLMGFFALAITPIALEVAVEYTYPIPEATSTGTLCAWGSFLAIFFIIIMSSLETEDGDMTRANWLGFGGFCLNFFLTFFLGTEYKRLKFEKS